MECWRDFRLLGRRGEKSIVLVFFSVRCQHWQGYWMCVLMWVRFFVESFSNCLSLFRFLTSSYNTMLAYFLTSSPLFRLFQPSINWLIENLLFYSVICYNSSSLTAINRKILKHLFSSMSENFVDCFFYVCSNSIWKEPKPKKKFSDRAQNFSGGSLAKIIRPVFFCLAIRVTYAVLGWSEKLQFWVPKVASFNYFGTQTSIGHRWNFKVIAVLVKKVDFLPISSISGFCAWRVEKHGFNFQKIISRNPVNELLPFFIIICKNVRGIR